MATQQEAMRTAEQQRFQPVKELRDSVFLLVLTVSSLSVYVGLGVLVVRLFAVR